MKLTKKLLDTWEKDCAGLPLQRSHTRLNRVLPLLRTLVEDWIPWRIGNKIPKDGSECLVLLDTGKIHRAVFVKTALCFKVNKSYYTACFWKYL